MSKKLKQKVYQYSAVFESNEDGGYTVTVPALPGLVTEGRDLKEAKNMADDAIICYLEGLKKAKESIPAEKEVGNFRLSVKL
ncbi:MAG: type II toxin-antitoxin system HicB family antitoxin [Patescibacteria group bacterium]